MHCVILAEDLSNTSLAVPRPLAGIFPQILWGCSISGIANFLSMDQPLILVSQQVIYFFDKGILFLFGV